MAFIPFACTMEVILPLVSFGYVAALLYGWAFWRQQSNPHPARRWNKKRLRKPDMSLFEEWLSEFKTAEVPPLKRVPWDAITNDAVRYGSLKT